MDGYRGHEIKRCSLLGRKAVTKLDSILKDRDITLPTNVHKVKTMFFPGVRYRWKSWTIKKAECWRSDLFELWCWRMEKTLECALDCKEIHPVNPKGNQLWIFSARTDAEAPLLWPPDEKSQLIEKKKILMLANIEGWSRRGDREWDVWMASATQWNEFEQALGDGDEQGSLEYWSSRVTGSQTGLSNWTTKARQGLYVQMAEPE